MDGGHNPVDTGSSEVDKVWMEATTHAVDTGIAVKLIRCGWRPQPMQWIRV